MNCFRNNDDEEQEYLQPENSDSEERKFYKIDIRFEGYMATAAQIFVLFREV